MMREETARGFDPHAVNWEPTDAMGEA